MTLRHGAARSAQKPGSGLGLGSVARPQGVAAISRVGQLFREFSALVVRIALPDVAASPDEAPRVVNLMPPAFGQKRIFAAAAETRKSPVTKKQCGVLHGRSAV